MVIPSGFTIVNLSSNWTMGWGSSSDEDEEGNVIAQVPDWIRSR
jgi:hypothetical protein